MSDFGARFRLTLITDDPPLAAEADAAGIERIGVDLERLGKADRQAGNDTRLSQHTWDDLAAIAPAVGRADLFVRTNPIHAGSEREIETALELRARVLMLPSFRTADEVASFVRMVRGRAQVLVLVELAPAVVRIRDILAVPGIDEVMLGLNDLHLQFGAANPFEMLASPVVEMLAGEVHQRGLPLGMGGVARPEDDELPIPPELIYAQYPRVGATGAWIARSFTRKGVKGFAEAVHGLRARLSAWSQSPPEALERARHELWRRAGSAAVTRNGRRDRLR